MCLSANSIGYVLLTLIKLLSRLCLMDIHIEFLKMQVWICCSWYFKASNKVLPKYTVYLRSWRHFKNGLMSKCLFVYTGQSIGNTTGMIMIYFLCFLLIWFLSQLIPLWSIPEWLSHNLFVVVLLYLTIQSWLNGLRVAESWVVDWFLPLAFNTAVRGIKAI